MGQSTVEELAGSKRHYDCSAAEVKQLVTGGRSRGDGSSSQVCCAF